MSKNRKNILSQEEIRQLLNTIPAGLQTLEIKAKGIALASGDIEAYEIEVRVN